MAFFQIQQLAAFCEPALAGLQLVTLYVPAEVAVLPDPLLSVYSAQEPEMMASKVPFTIPFDKFSASLNSEPDTTTRPGDFWQHTINMDLRKNRQEVAQWMWKMRNRRFHILTQDWLGVRMWFPDMRLASTRTQDAPLAGANRTSFSLFRNWNHPGIYLAPVPSPQTPNTAWGDPDAPETWDFGGDPIGNP